MKNLPFDTVNLDANEVEALADAYKALQSKFNIGLPDNSHINKFELFNNEKEASVSGLFLIDHPSTDCYLTFVKIHYQFVSGRTNVNNFKCQAWAFVNLKKDFGRVLIRKETFTDRMLELVHPIELKFKDDKEFSNKFYVVTNDKEKALEAMDWDFRDVLMDINTNDFVVEIIGKILVIRYTQPIEAAQTVHLAELAGKIALLQQKET